MFFDLMVKKVIVKWSDIMKYVKLGKSDLYVSRICMGCMSFGDAKKECIRGRFRKQSQEKS